jgi:cellulose synthase/poly-beta-1,6-N-acetylglucosamine synthase-like glycosyltransferase
LIWLFWVCLFLGTYPFFIYPVLAALLSKLHARRVHARADFLPSVTVLTAAFNEARHIEQTVRNKLAQDYPPELLDVIVISDESADGTDEIVQRLAAESDGRVRLMRQSPRQGKTAALNLAMLRVRGEIVVFSDANSMYRPHTVRRLVANFADREVGYVTGKMIYVNADGSVTGDGCSAYMRYENWLRAVETRLGSIVGVDGGVDAVRAKLYRGMRPDQLPDFVLPLDVVEQGYRVVFERDAVLTEESLSSQSSEYRMRVRVALRALWALRDKRALLNPFRFGLFAWQLLSHKVLRYLTFLPLGVAGAVSLVLAIHQPIYRLVVLAEAAFLLLALSASIGPAFVARSALGRLSGYFLLLNVASAVAFVRFLRGQKQVLWQPRVG